MTLRGIEMEMAKHRIAKPASMADTLNASRGRRGTRQNREEPAASRSSGMFWIALVGLWMAWRRVLAVVECDRSLAMAAFPYVFGTAVLQAQRED